MAKNKKVMSLAIDPDLHEELKEYVKRKDMSVSEYLGLLVKKAVKVSVDDDPVVVGKPIDEDVMPVVLKIPSALKGNRDGLKQWLDTQTTAIVTKLGG